MKAAMKNNSIRRDFLSDSSSDDDGLPNLGSLRERLARKRQFSTLSSCITTQTASLDCKDSKIAKDDSDKSEIILSMDTEVHSYSSVSACTGINTQTVDLVNSEDELEQLSHAQIIQTSASHEKAVKIHTVAEVTGKFKEDKGTEIKLKKKRTAEEIEESRRKAQEKKEIREMQKATKEAEKQMRKVERESKKQFSLGSCLKYIKVQIDTHVVNTGGLGVAIFKACEELGVSCETKELPLPFTIMWKREVTECNMSDCMKVQTIQSEIGEHEMLAIVPVADFVHMVNSFKMRQMGQYEDGISFRDYVNQMKACLPDKTITLIVLGLEQYFKDLKSKTQKQFKEAVQAKNHGHAGKPSKVKPGGLVTVSRVDIEEAVTDTLLQTGCSTFMLETPDEVADTVRRFSKAVAERPAKKDRFDPIFSFHEEGVGGVKVDKNGVGLLKVWKQQLLQFKNVSPDIAQAIITEYPSPLLLRQMYQKCVSEKEAVKLLENIVVRRGAGVLETTRRIGKELSRRIYTFFTNEDPGFVIK